MNLNGSSQQSILVVDDDAMVLQLVCTILEMKGYSVVRALGPIQAIQTSLDHIGIIDLLVSDVTMPDMSGVQLAENLLEHRPELRVIFMSGDSDGAMLFLNYGWKFVQKPFVSETLLRLVAEVLRGPRLSEKIDRFDTRQ